MTTFEQWTSTALQEYKLSHPVSGGTHLLQYVFPQLELSGYWLEFGVAAGDSLKWIASVVENKPSKPKVVGFDSFDGLSEAWFIHQQGTFKQRRIPVIEGAEIVVGMFEDTLNNWLKINNPVITFVHIDCDLYSSTRYVLKNIAPFLAKNAIIEFDELVGYAEFKDHEWKALYETSIQDKLFDFEWLGHRATDDGQQVAIKLK